MIDEFGKWHGWNGGECPVDRDVVVEVMFGNGNQPSGEALYWDWDHKIEPVIAYRIKKEPKVFTDAVWIEAEDGGVYLSGFCDRRKAIITTQGDRISVKWSDT